MTLVDGHDCAAGLTAEGIVVLDIPERQLQLSFDDLTA